MCQTSEASAEETVRCQALRVPSIGGLSPARVAQVSLGGPSPSAAPALSQLSSVADLGVETTSGLVVSSHLMNCDLSFAALSRLSDEGCPLQVVNLVDVECRVDA